MKEILRADRISVDTWLTDYSLRLYEGEIVCVQSLSDTSIDCLMDVLAGEVRPDAGNIYVDEERIDDYSEAFARQKGIYAMTLRDEFAPKSTVLEYMAPVRPVYSLVRRQQERERLLEYFREEQIDIDPDRQLWTLNSVDRRKLWILKTRLRKARMLILNLGSENIGGRLADELKELILRIRSEGTTVLILSYFYPFLAPAADRVQVMNHGMALKEWTHIGPAEQDLMKFGRNFRRILQPGAQEKRFLGMYDYEWDIQDGFWAFLRTVRTHNLALWAQQFGVSIPENGVGFADHVAVIPRFSQDMLIGNLDAAENLTIALDGRVTYGATNIINPRLERKAAADFCRRQGKELSSKKISDLSGAERKILSIARFELCRPRVIFLELPYAGIDLDEIRLVREYLIGLADRGIQIVVFTQSLESVQMDCAAVIQTQNGCRAQLLTATDHV